MRANSTNQEELFQTDDIVRGFGEVAAVHTERGTGWLLPGRVITFDRRRAETTAMRLDFLIQANMKRFDRDLIW